MASGSVAPVPRPLAAVTGPVREERRVVTVLFADLAGFTSRSEALDPEDVRAFLVPYYDVLTSEIERHGGHVDRFLGDGVMALFGAPTAHEDDPERAVRAALRILERIPSLGLDLHLRLGINTGGVLYAAATGERDDSVTGDAVNTAARLQAAAPVDAVVVGETTYRATAHLFRYEPLEPIRAKGKAEPVPLWRPLEPIARRAGELHPEATPFVGRDVELALLVALFERARATPTLELVTILAEPGLGKSRLVRELARHLDALPDLVTWRLGRCLPYGDGAGLWALGEIVKAHAGILDTDDQAAVSARLDAVLTEPDPSLRAWMKDRLGPLVGLQVTSEPPQQEEAFTAWRRFVESIARRGPTVLVVEDLHWADDTLVAFLSHLADHVAGLPLLLVTTARPELEERHPAWLSRTRRSSVVSLAALPEPSMAALVAELIPRASPEMMATILERAAGSPLYAEQLAAILRDRPAVRRTDGLDDEAIPPSIAALLAARIDALPAAPKAVLLDASVIGRTFWPGAVAAVGGHEPTEVERHLGELARRDLIRPAYPSSMEDEDGVHVLARAPSRRRLRGADAACPPGKTPGHGGLDHREGRSSPRRGRRDRRRPPRPGPRAGGHHRSDGDRDAAQGEPGPGTPRRGRSRFGDRGPPRPRPSPPRPRAPRTRWTRSVPAPLPPSGAPSTPRRTTRRRWRRWKRPSWPCAPAARQSLRPSWELRSRSPSTTRDGCTTPRRPSQPAGSSSSDTPGPGLVAILAEEAVLRSNADHADAHDRAEETIALAASLGLPPPPRALVIRASAPSATDLPGRERDLRAAIEGAVNSGDLRTASIAFQEIAIGRGNSMGPASGLVAFDEAIAFCAAHGLASGRTRAIRTTGLLDMGEWDELLAEAADVWAWALEHGDVPAALTAGVATAYARLGRGEPIESAADLASMARDLDASPTWVAPIVAETAAARGTPGGSATNARRGPRCHVPRRAVGPVPVRPDLPPRRGSRTRPSLGRDRGHSDQSASQRCRPPGPWSPRPTGISSPLGWATNPWPHPCHSLGCPPDEAYALTGLGRCLLALGETEEGVARLRESRAIWERLRATPRIAEIDALLAAAPTA